ncbi:MAG TPA: outer membrane beta-barrel protein [Steroidobacteraceae bacterium]
MDIRNLRAANRAGIWCRYVAATLGLCISVAPAAHAQSVTGSVTTGAVIPENAPLTATPATGRSQAVNFGVSVGIGETDNIFQTSTDERSQTMELTGIDFGWMRTGSALDANVVGNFNYLDYLQGAYASQLLGRFDGLTSLSLFEDHLKWFLQDDFGEGQLDPYAPSTPTNLEHVNYLTTGPEFTLRPISDTVLQAGARYALATYQVSPFNGWRMSENVLLERLLSPNSNVALGAESEQLRFDDTAFNSDYDRSRFYVRYDISGARTHLTAAVGETQTNDGGRTVATPLVQFDLTHNLAPQTVLTFTAGRQFTDAADAFSDLRGGAAGGIVVAPVAETTEDYLDNYVTAGLQLTGRRTTISATAAYERDVYAIDDAFNVTHASLELRADRQLSEILSADVFGAVIQSRYFDQGGHINSNIVGASVTWQAGRTLAVEARYAHNFQDTSVPGSGFSSNLVFVTVTYRPIPAASPLAPSQ